MKCKVCGFEFDAIQAMYEYNGFFGGRHNYLSDNWNDACAECAINIQIDIDEGYDVNDNLFVFKS